MGKESDTHRVAVVAVPAVVAFDLAIPVQVFADRSRYVVTVCAAEPGMVATTSGFGLEATGGADAIAAADTIVVPGFHGEPATGVLDALRTAAQRGARVTSICTGAFALAEAGLLDGRRATTHWDHAAELARRYPAVHVDPDVIYVDEGRLLTSAGMAAGIDLCLHLLTQDHGPEVALDRARRMVVPVHRAGNQAQYVVSAPGPTEGAVTAALAWAEAHLADPIGVEQLARHAHLAPRTFARQVVAATGASPYEWLTRRRLAVAARLLETRERSIEQVAAASGLGTATNLRLHFRRVYGTTPTAYRAAFVG
jgi:transcriptional regulator GlxA family with amidase domain